MRRSRGRLLFAVLLGLGIALVPAGPASAHPLGNFTVNSANRIVLGPAQVRVTHFLDLAEIPTIQLKPQVDTDRDGRLSNAELTAYAGDRCRQVASGLELTVDGKPATLVLGTVSGESRPGAAGLTTTRLVCDMSAAGQARDRVDLLDPTSGTRVGWREMTARAQCGRILSSDVPAASPSAELTAYPKNLLTSPLDVREAHLKVSASGGCTAAAADREAVVQRALPRGVDRVTTAYTDFVARQTLTFPIGLLAVLLSILLGAVHALAPGHGKTVMAAYLVGQRGTKRQAFWLGTTVTLTHTAGVLLLGVILTLGTLGAPERVVPATQILSGLLLAGVGVGLLARAVRRVRATPDHAHDDQPHDHGHDHGHGHEHPHDQAPAGDAGTHSHGGRAHTHAPPPDGPLGWRSLAVMGVAGGLVPSPSALVVLLGATALGRAYFGALLVFGYGLGLALTLTLAGLLLLRAQGLLTRRSWAVGRGLRWARLLPPLTAAIVVFVGVGLVVRGVMIGRGLV